VEYDLLISQKLLFVDGRSSSSSLVYFVQLHHILKKIITWKEGWRSINGRSTIWFLWTGLWSKNNCIFETKFFSHFSWSCFFSDWREEKMF